MKTLFPSKGKDKKESSCAQKTKGDYEEWFITYMTEDEIQKQKLTLFGDDVHKYIFEQASVSWKRKTEEGRLMPVNFREDMEGDIFVYRGFFQKTNDRYVFEWDKILQRKRIKEGDALAFKYDRSPECFLFKIAEGVMLLPTLPTLSMCY